MLLAVAMRRLDRLDPCAPRKLSMRPTCWSALMLLSFGVAASLGIRGSGRSGGGSLAVAVSLPSVFVIGTIAVVGWYEVLARRRTMLVFAYGGFLVAVGLASAAMAALGQYHMSPEDRLLPTFLGGGVSHPFLARPGSLGRLADPDPPGPLFTIPWRKP